MRKQFKRGCAAVLLLLILLMSFAALYPGRGKPETVRNVHIEMQPIKIESAGDGGGAGEGAAYGDVEMPRFVSDTGKTTPAMDRLNREIDALEEEIRELREQQAEESEEAGEANSGTGVQLRSYVHDGSRYLQLTVLVSPALSGEDAGETAQPYRLMTLAYDRQEDESILCRDALLLAGIGGDTLSINVNSAYVASGMPGAVEATDMQGFRLNEDGSVGRIYMQLRTREQDAELPEIKFYSYDPLHQSIRLLEASELEAE